MTNKKYYLLEGVPVWILDSPTKHLNKKGFVVIQCLEGGQTATVKESKLKKRGSLEEYFKNKK